jgi:hypothetical protein
MQSAINKEYNLSMNTQGKWKRGALMRKLVVLLPMALFIAFVSTALSQDLADIAKKEKERREGIKNDRVITEEEAAKYVSEPSKAAPPSDQQAVKTDSDKDQNKEAKTESGATAQGEKPATDEPTDFQGRPESYWRKTATDCRQKIKDLEIEANVLTLKRADLQTKFYNVGDGYQQQEIQKQIQKAIFEQDQNKEKLDKAKADLDDLLKEARSSGAPPGWVEGR